MGFVGLVVVVVLSAVPSPQFTWTVTSNSGAATLTQTALPDDACTLRCELAGKPTWTQQTCLGRNTDFVFVSDDCATSLLVFEYPLRANTTQDTPVAIVFKPAGGPTPVKLGQLLDPSRLRGEGRRVRWLAGVVGEPGLKPHLNPAGTAIEFGTLDGAAHTVRFEKPEDFFAHKAAPAPVAEGTASGDGLYQYVGADGSTQFVQGLSQVPARYRKQATLVESDVSTVKGTKMPWRPPSYEPSPPAQPSSAGTQGPARRTKYSTQEPSSDCVFGLSGPACDAVRNAERLPPPRR